MNTRIRHRRDDAGFTLIELLIVVVVLGVLAGVTVFAVGAFDKEGVQAACSSDAKAVQVAQEAFKAKTGSYATQWSDLTGGKYLVSQPNGGTKYTVTLTGTCTVT